MIKADQLRQAWAEGRTITNTLLTIPSAWTAELVAHAGFDAVTIDMQHGLAGFQTALTMLQAIDCTPSAPLVRLRWNEPSHIMQMLDAGAVGLICPMIETAGDTSAFVRACQYPPAGIRSFGPVRARLYAGGDYFQTANRSILTFAMVETAAAAENLEQIARTPGLTGLFVGPYDLSVSLGLKKIADVRHPDMEAILHRIISACEKNDLIAGIYTSSPEDAAFLAGMGFRLLTLSADSGMLEKAAREATAFLQQKISRK